MKNIVIILTFLTLNLILNNNCLAQKKCKDALERAEKLYQKGLIDSTIKILTKCSNVHANPESSFDAYRLLALCYFFNKDYNKTDISIEKMLLLNPNYQKFPNIDPVDFTNYLKKYEVLQKLYLGIKFGLNITNVILNKSYSIYNSKQTYNPTFGYQLGITSEYYLKNNLSLDMDLFLSGMSFNHKIENAGGWLQNYEEQSNYYYYSIGAKYYFPVNEKLKLSAGIGVGIFIMNKAVVYFETENIDTKTLFQATKNTINERNKYQPILKPKIGLNTIAGKGLFNFEIEYQYFTNNIVNDGMRLNDQTFILDNQYKNDDISFQSFTFNVSYSLPIFSKILKHNK